MRTIIRLVIGFVLCGNPTAYADQPLTCRSDNGRFVATLKLDLDQGTLMWGPLAFVIVSTKNDFITARTKDGVFNVGGEYWVIQQNTGGYRRTSVGWGCTDPTMLSCALTATTDHGVCHKD